MGLAVFALYALGALVLGKIIAKSAADESSFYVNNRSSNAALVAFSIVASCIGASATIGTVGLAFSAVFVAAIYAAILPPEPERGFR